MNHAYQTIRVGELQAQYIQRGSGHPLILLHGDGDNAADWQWVWDQLAATHSVYAPDLSGFDGNYRPDIDYSSTFYCRFISDFLDALGIPQATVVGNSFGGLAALRFALNAPERVSALVLVDTAGLGRAINPVMRPLTLPAFGDLGITWAATPAGAMQRAWFRAGLLFARPKDIPPAWIAEQYRLARTPGFLQTALAALRAAVDLGGQREVLVDRLPELQMPTCILWGEQDRVVPISQAQTAVTLLRHGAFVSISQCGHLPHVEQPDRFLTGLSQFLGVSGAAR